jgi:hypothetical protein
VLLDAAADAVAEDAAAVGEEPGADVPQAPRETAATAYSQRRK